MIYVFTNEEKRNNNLKKYYDESNELRDKRITNKDVYEENIRKIISLKSENNQTGDHTLLYLTIGNAYFRYAEMLFRENQDGRMYNQKAIENFKKASEAETNARYKALAELNIGKCYRYVDDTENTRTLFRNLYQKLQTEDNSNKKNIDIACEAINSMAESYRDSALHRQALYFYKLSVKIISSGKYVSIHDNYDIADINLWYNDLEKSAKEKIIKDINGNLEKIKEQALLNIGIILKRETDIEYAVKTFECLLYVNSENNDAINDIGVCYRKLNLINAAINTFKSNTNVSKTFFAKLNLCKCYMVNDMNKAKRMLYEIIKEYPHKSRTYILHAQFLMENKKYQLAINKLNLAKKEDQFLKKHYLKIDYLIACCYKNLHLYHEAINIYSRILGTSNDDYKHENDCACLSNMADCLMALNFYDQASEYYEKAYSNFNKSSLDFWKEKNYNNYVKKLTIYKHTSSERNRVFIYDNNRSNIYSEFFHNWGICIYNQYMQMTLNTTSEDRKDDKIKLLNSAIEKFEAAQEYSSKKTISLCYKADCLREMYNVEHEDEYKRKYELEYESIKTSLFIDDEVNSKYIIYLINKYLEISNTSNNIELLKKIQVYISNGVIYHTLDSILSIINLCENILNSDNELSGDTNKELSEIRDSIYSSIYKYRILGAGNCELINTLLDSDNFKKISTDNKAIIFKYLIMLYTVVIKIKDNCRYYPESDENGNNVYKTKSPLGVHYTNLNTLKLLLSKKDKQSNPKFRLWNSSYMNDLAEGTILVTEMISTYADNEIKENLVEFMSYCFPDVVNKIDDDEKDFDTIQYYNSNMYLSSLSVEDDYLSMWIHYGNNASGCSIKFNDDFFDYNYQKPYDIKLDDYDYSEFPLYRTQYLDGNDLNDELKNNVMELYGLLSDTYKEIKKDNFSYSEKNQVYLLTRSILDEIRFLFKDKNYSYENEIRVMKSSRNPIIDYNFEIPRLYIEVNKEVAINEVRVAPKITDYSNIMPWLFECKNVVKIKKSNVKYK